MRKTLGPMNSATFAPQQTIAQPRASMGASRVPIRSAESVSPSRSRKSIAAPSNTVQAKAAVPTAQPTSRQSISTNSRYSSVGSGRVSSLRGVGNDPRPIGDRNFMNACIRQLITYLSEHNYDYAISPKILNRPTTKDFSNIITFLLRKFDPNFAITGKFEDEVIQAFKYLNYPFPISKTGLVAVGSPHTWPALMAALSWLVELLLYDEARTMTIAEEDEEFASYRQNRSFNQDYKFNDDDLCAADDDESIRKQNKDFYHYLSSSYRCFMTADDESYSQLEADYISKFESKNVKLNHHVEATRAENESIRRQIQEAMNRKSQLSELIQKRDTYESEKSKLGLNISQAREYKASLDSKLTLRVAEVDKIKHNITDIESDVSVLRERISRQLISPVDVERMMNNRKQTDAAMNEISSLKAQYTQKLWKSDADLTEKLRDLNDVVDDYNTRATVLGLIPSNARNANGKNFELEVDVVKLKQREVMNMPLLNNVPIWLNSFKSSVSDKTREIRESLLVKLDEDFALDSKLSDKMNELERVEVNLTKSDDDIKREKAANEEEIIKKNGELSALSKSLQEKKDLSTGELISTKKRQVQDSINVYNKKKKEYEDTKNSVIAEMMEVLGSLADYQERAREVMKETRIDYLSHMMMHDDDDEGRTPAKMRMVMEGDGDEQAVPLSVRRSTPVASSSSSSCKKTIKCVNLVHSNRKTFATPIPAANDYDDDDDRDGNFSYSLDNQAEFIMNENELNHELNMSSLINSCIKAKKMLSRTNNLMVSDVKVVGGVVSAVKGTRTKKSKNYRASEVVSRIML